jgi:hypothetical protein
VIRALSVELRRLLPQLAGELVPARRWITTLGVERGEVENGRAVTRSKLPRLIAVEGYGMTSIGALACHRTG